MGVGGEYDVRVGGDDFVHVVDDARRSRAKEARSLAEETRC